MVAGRIISIWVLQRSSEDAGYRANNLGIGRVRKGLFDTILQTVISGTLKVRKIPIGRDALTSW